MSPSAKDIQITLRIPGELAQQLDKHAERTRTNRSWVIREALHHFFASATNNHGATNNVPNQD